MDPLENDTAASHVALNAMEALGAADGDGETQDPDSRGDDYMPIADDNGDAEVRQHSPISDAAEGLDGSEAIGAANGDGEGSDSSDPLEAIGAADGDGEGSESSNPLEAIGAADGDGEGSSSSAMYVAPNETSSDDESGIWERRMLKPTVSADSEETLILGGSRPDELASVLPDLVDGFNARMNRIMSSPPPAVPPPVAGRTSWG